MYAEPRGYGEPPKAREPLQPTVEELEELEERTHVCVRCNSGDDNNCPILLCDSCDSGWHLSCLAPPLAAVPPGRWCCPSHAPPRCLQVL